MKKNTNKIKSLKAVCDGEAMPMSRVPDEAFSTEMLGKGFAIEPEGSLFVCPADGKVESIATTRHAYTLLTEDGLDLLIHVGVDTVELDGEGFEPLVSEGQRVEAGDPLVRIDPDEIRQKGFSAMTAVVITNPEKIENIEYRFGAVTAGETPAMTFRICRKG